MLSIHDLNAPPPYIPPTSYVTAILSGSHLNHNLPDESVSAAGTWCCSFYSDLSFNPLESVGGER